MVIGEYKILGFMMRSRLVEQPNMMTWSDSKCRRYVILLTLIPIHYQRELIYEDAENFATIIGKMGKIYVNVMDGCLVLSNRSIIIMMIWDLNSQFIIMQFSLLRILLAVDEHLPETFLEILLFTAIHLLNIIQQYTDAIGASRINPSY